MKLFLITLSLSFQAIAMEAPICMNDHWYSPYFKLVTGGEYCKGRVITCNFKGTESEGFYSYSKKTERRLTRDNCSASNTKPRCFDRGSIDSGWYLNGSFIANGICFSNEEAVCAYIGTKNEGWFIYQTDTRNKVVPIDCAD